MTRATLTVLLGVVGLLAVAGSASAVNAFDHGFLGAPLEEIEDVDGVANVTDPRWGGGVTDFDSTIDTSDLLLNNSLDNYALNNTPDRLSDDLTVVGVINVTETQLDNVASPHLVIAEGTVTSDPGSGLIRYFGITASAQTLGDGEISLVPGHDDCASQFDQSHLTFDEGFIHFAFRLENDTSNAWDVNAFQNGTLEHETTLTGDPCVNLNTIFNDNFAVGCDRFESGDNSCGSGDHFPGEIYDLRVFQRALSDEEIEDLAEANGELELGDEAALYTFGDNITGLVNPPPPPEPVDFADGIQDAAAAWGFRTAESQMFFAVAWIGVTTVGVGVGTKLMRSGRTKNAVIAGSALVVGVFFVFVEMLRFWQLATAAILAGFALFGGPREIKNTWQEVTEAGREMVREARLGGEPETVEVDADLVDEHPPGQRGPDLAPEGEEDALEVQVLGEASEPDLSPSVEPDGGDE